MGAPCALATLKAHAPRTLPSRQAMDLSPWASPPSVIELGPDHLDLWLIELDVSAGDIDQAHLVLSSDEMERARRFHFERDARRYAAAHAALRSILGRYLARLPQALSFQTSSHGKPHLAPGGLYAIPDLSFNLSHSGELGLLGVTRARRVGVDIEHIRPAFADGRIAEQFFSPAEVRDLRSLPAKDRPAAFFRCWTRKEAFVKARGEGLSLPLESFDVSLLPGHPPALLRLADERDRADRWSLHLVTLPDGWPYEAAAAVEGTVSDVRQFRFLRIA